MESCCFIAMFGYVPFLVVRWDWVAIDANTCGVCDYDRTGLKPGALCPECGSDPNAAPVLERRLHVSKERLVRLAGVALVCLALLVACLIVESAAQEIIAWKVRRLGYSADVAARYAAVQVTTLNRRPLFIAPYLFLLLAPLAVLFPARWRVWIPLAIVAAGIVAWKASAY